MSFSSKIGLLHVFDDFVFLYKNYKLDGAVLHSGVLGDTVMARMAKKNETAKRNCCSSINYTIIVGKLHSFPESLAPFMSWFEPKKIILSTLTCFSMNTHNRHSLY